MDERRNCIELIVHKIIFVKKRIYEQTSLVEEEKVVRVEEKKRWVFGRTGTCFKIFSDKVR